MTPLTTKAARHQRIADLLSRNAVHTQDQLRAQLLESGLDVTQATLSRDLVEIRAIKVLAADGSSVYAIPDNDAALSENETQHDADARLARVTAEVLTAADFAQNVVVLHTKPGAANYLAGAIDRNAWPDVLGSVAGDDTVIVVAKSTQAAEQMCEALLALVSQKRKKK